MKKWDRAGLTLLEVVTSLWLLFIAIVMAASVLHRVLHHNKIEEQRSRAAYLAQEKMEELMLLAASELNPQVGHFAPPFENFQWEVFLDPVPAELRRMIKPRVVVTTPLGSKYELSTIRRGKLEKIWFASNKNASRLSRLYQVNEDGTERQQIDTKSVDCNDHFPTLSPGGRDVVFLSDRTKKRQLYRMPTDSSAPPAALTDHPIGVQDPDWSPDGTRIAYVAYVSGFSQIHVLDLATGESRAISRKGAHEGAPRWSYDSQRVVFTATDVQRGGTQLGVMDADGNDRQVLTKAEGWNTAGSFSPDGQQVVFMSNRSGDADVFLMNLDGGKTQQLTSESGYDNSPRFSTDGKTILFSSDRQGFTTLYLMDPDGENQRQLIADEAPSLPESFEKEATWVSVPK